MFPYQPSPASPRLPFLSLCRAASHSQIIGLFPSPLHKGGWGVVFSCAPRCLPCAEHLVSAGWTCGWNHPSGCLALTPGLGSHIWLGSLLASASWPKSLDRHGQELALEAVLEDSSYLGCWAFSGDYPMERKSLASRSAPQDSSLQEALQAL